MASSQHCGPNTQADVLGGCGAGPSLGWGGFRQSCRLNTPCPSLPHPGAGGLGGQRPKIRASGDSFKKTATQGEFKIFFFNHLLQSKDYKWKLFLKNT